MSDSESEYEEEGIQVEGEDSESDCESVSQDDGIPATFGENFTNTLQNLSLNDITDPVEPTYIPPSLNNTPDFVPLVSPFLAHQSQSRVPPSIDRKSPLAFFKLFVSDNEFETFAANTNAYANYKQTTSNTNSSKQFKKPRRWLITSVKELMVWFGLLIFMGLVKTGAKNSRIDTYWRMDGQLSFEPMKHMGLCRFEQLKQYFHLSPPQLPKTATWYAKIEPFSKALRDASQQYLLPATELSIDEMMVRFTGRSSHTIKMKNKPIKQGFKLFALCWRGFTISYLYSSRTKKIGEVKKLPDHSLTSSAVIYLAKTLPYQFYRFDLYMDNYFTNIPLFASLRKLGIGACGTTRQGSKQFPRAFAKKKASKSTRPEWNTMEGEVIDEVLALIWMDNNFVLLLTTIHAVKGIANYVLRLRRRPGLTSTNAKIVRPVFNGQQTRQLLIPIVVDMYNYFMGGVDIADQRRSYWPTQLRVCRTWLPLFFWCLDTAIVNAFILYRIVNITAGELAKNILSHREFREKLYQQLIAEGSPPIRRKRLPMQMF